MTIFSDENFTRVLALVGKTPQDWQNFKTSCTTCLSDFMNTTTQIVFGVAEAVEQNPEVFAALLFSHRNNGLNRGFF
jgi:hypothetical protein